MRSLTYNEEEVIKDFAKLLPVLIERESEMGVPPYQLLGLQQLVTGLLWKECGMRSMPPSSYR